MNENKEIKKLFLQRSDEIGKNLKLSKQYNKSIDNVCCSYKILIEKLDSSSIKMLDKIMDEQSKILSIEVEEAFIMGFSLANKLIFESANN